MVEAQIYWSDNSDCLVDAMVTIVKAWDKGMSITRDATLSVFKIMKHASIKDETLHNRFAEIV
jgi:hypothetical protein